MKKYLELIIGIFILAFSFNLFCVPDNLASTGISGLSIIVSNFIPIDKSLFILIINVILILVAYKFLGKNFCLNSIVGSILYPVVLKLTSLVTPYIDLSNVDLLIKAFVGGILMGIGAGLVFKSGFNTGGTDIIESIVTKYFKISMDTAIIIVDGLIVIGTGFTFGVEHLIYALMILFGQSIFSNRFMLGIEDDKILYINSKKKKEIIKFLKETYNYGITIINSKGGFTNKSMDTLMISIRHNFYLEIKEAIKLIDKDAFITVVNSYETRYIDKEERNLAKK